MTTESIDPEAVAEPCDHPSKTSKEIPSGEFTLLRITCDTCGEVLLNMKAPN